MNDDQDVVYEDSETSTDSGCDIGAILKGMAEPHSDQLNLLSEESSSESSDSSTTSSEFEYPEKTNGKTDS